VLGGGTKMTQGPTLQLFIPLNSYRLTTVVKCGANITDKCTEENC